MPLAIQPLLLLKAILLGIIEGLTEFIPVSSTGHLIVAQHWLRFIGERENAFIIFIQLGAILAVVVQYRAKFMNLVFGWPRDPAARRLIGHLLLGTVPAVLIGLPTNDWIEAHFFNPLAVALALVLGGVAILLVEAWYARSARREDRPLTTKQALGIGLFQVLALLFPGTSRSGATIMGGLVLGLSRSAATEFSFFLAVPALLGATAVKLYHARHVLSGHDLPMFAIGFVVSFLVALQVIRFLIAFVSHNTFRAFAWYRIAFGILLLWFFRNSHF